VPISRERAVEALASLQGSGIRFVTAAAPMGADALEQAGISDYEIGYQPECDGTTAADTRAAVRAFVAHGVDLILFCGGDGTARDVAAAAGRTPILGIPAGVKMFSGVFALRPGEVAAVLTGDFILADAEVMDIDEEAYRRGELRARLFALVRTPTLGVLVQGSKAVFSGDESAALDGIARFMADLILSGGTTVLGAGSTTAAIARTLGLEKTLLGVDVIRDGKVAAADADERTLLFHVETADRCRIIVSPIGAQGSVLGRGTQQLSPAVVRAAGVGSVIVVATPQKLAATPLLFVDTGDAVLDAAFGESIPVICGYHAACRIPLAARSRGVRGHNN
jgi:predicted polyphosphate/ATP-dependent NAD kinase